MAVPQNTRVVDLQSLIRADRKEVKSITGEVTMNLEENWCSVNAPKAQGVAGFFSERNRFELADVTIESGNEYAAALVVSLDDQPLSQSGRILIQIGTSSRPTGWEQRPVSIAVSSGGTLPGFEILSVGRSPWEVIRPAVEVEIRNEAITEGFILDENGDARGSLALEGTDGAVRFHFPEDALYVLLVEGPDLSIAATHAGNFMQAETGASYTMVVTNSGGMPSSGTVTVTDHLPAGLSARAMSGSGWACDLGSLTCTRQDGLGAGASYPAITLAVDISPTAPRSLLNTVTVSGGADVRDSNNTATDPMLVRGQPRFRRR